MRPLLPPKAFPMAMSKAVSPANNMKVFNVFFISPISPQISPAACD
jgi:hypothetical protein